MSEQRRPHKRQQAQIKQRKSNLPALIALAKPFRKTSRRDCSNQPFLLTARPVFLKQEQHTATLGLIRWFGRKQGGW